MSETLEAGWSEENSVHFIEAGRVAIPAREEIEEVILDLIPAERNEPFSAVELGVGGGWLSEAVLERFPASRVIGLDGSPTMLQATANRLQRFEGRFELTHFRLEDDAWLAALGLDVRCFLSSLVIHHLDGAGKQALYRELYRHLEPGGGLLVADLIAPASERERQYMARAYDSEIRRRSLELTGSLDTYRDLTQKEWNWFEFPDPFDKPSTIAEHLHLLAEAGFSGASMFWAKAGHAVYGGFRE